MLTWGNGYTMEKLNPLPRNIIDHKALAVEMALALGKEVWDEPAEVEFDENAHCDKVFALAGKYLGEDDRRMLWHWFSSIDWSKQDRCLTHGDPTFENVMLRSNEKVVIIDPVPATPAVPDLRLVDVGKVMQSVVGFEAIKYGAEERFRLTMHDALEIFYVNDSSACMYWCVVHLLRAIPYQTSEEVQRDLIAEVSALVRSFRR